MATFSKRSWLQEVVARDERFYFDREHPDVYYFGQGTRPKRDPGGQGGPYAGVPRRYIRVTSGGRRRTTHDGNVREVLT